jgi:hypothetical protein|tara:strand:- start:105 stop:581 length:477 start_codon:yes stop_codon:yes gene_type:complete
MKDDNCPGKYLPSLLRLANPLVFEQAIVPSEGLSLEELAEILPGSSEKELRDLHLRGQVGDDMDYLDLRRFVGYAGGSLGVDDEKLFERGFSKLREHVDECVPCRIFYLESYTDSEVEGFYSVVPGGLATDPDVLARNVDNDLLGLREPYDFDGREAA